MKYGCIGERLGHSFSPEIHKLLGDYDYRLLELAPDELAPFLQARDFLGINVTIPYKAAVIPYLDRISSTASAIGAVNTVVNRQGLLWGDNTDYLGLRALIRRMGLCLSGKKVLILGTGGTGHTARAVAADLGAAEILSVSRSKRQDAVTYEEACRFHADADILINTTPCGMFPDTEACPVDPACFSKLSGVADVVFNPLASRLVLRARELKIPAEGGLYMLVAQAAAASEHFTGRPCPPEQLEDIYQKVLNRRRNLVLIGMPGCGKTAVGCCLSAALERPFIDLDDVVARHAGKTIPRIFEEDGEASFRDLESDAVWEAAGKTGFIISTGGGCILRSENLQRLKMNGTLVFLDRSPAELRPSDSRPLADTQEKLAQLYRQRYPLYLAAADRVIRVCGSVEDTAEAVISCTVKEAER